jgi:glucose-1-phosphate thymidylyltransferase short form
LLACLIVAPQRGYDEPAIFSYAISSFCPTSADGLHAIQPKPEGLAQAFLIGADFIGESTVSLVLGDNIFFGHGLPEMLAAASARNTGATVFGYQVRDPQRYGVVSFDEQGRASGIVEKPKSPVSNWAVTGLYFYDNNVVRYASEIRPSNRGELEITDLNMQYLRAGTLEVTRMGRGFAWLDTGTFESLIDAASFGRPALGAAPGFRAARQDRACAIWPPSSTSIIAPPADTIERCSSRWPSVMDQRVHTGLPCGVGKG